MMELLYHVPAIFQPQFYDLNFIYPNKFYIELRDNLGLNIHKLYIKENTQML